MKLSKHRVLLCGILSPVFALILYGLVYATLTRYSPDLEKDWLFRLSLSTIAMTIPGFATIALAVNARRTSPFSFSAKIGLLVATLSLGLAASPIRVVLVNIWATWCGPCRSEMPKLDHLYRERKERGLVVFGISDEDVEVQQKYLQRVPVNYPLLTVKGTVPSLYRDIARYPAFFLIDRSGRLQPAPGPDQPFDKLEAVVETLLSSGS